MDLKPSGNFPEISIEGKTGKGKILVAYASRTGSTGGVAIAIGEILAESGSGVDVRLMENVGTLTPYSSVVAGSAIQGRQWLPEAIDFIQTHQKELSQKPFAAFLVCLTLAMKNPEKYKPFVQTWLNPVRAEVKPISEGFFPGILNIGKIPSFSDRLKFRLSVFTGVWKEGDHRNWGLIKSWAKELSALLE